MIVPPRMMRHPSVRSKYDSACTDDGHADEDTTFVSSVGSENCGMEMRTSPTRFVDTVTDSCWLCGNSIGNVAQVRLQCEHHYHLACWTRWMRNSSECIKCNPEMRLQTPSPVWKTRSIEDRMLQEFALRAYRLLQQQQEQVTEA